MLETVGSSWILILYDMETTFIPPNSYKQLRRVGHGRPSQTAFISRYGFAKQHGIAAYSAIE